jgi:copper transport protein
VKIALLGLALLLASVNLLRTVSRFKASAGRPELGTSASILLRRLVAGETLLVAGAILAAAVLSSLAPPSKALASVGTASAHVGPGAVARIVQKNGYRLAFRFSPNRAAVPNSFQVQIDRGGRPVRNADVTTAFTMLDMEMGQQAYRLAETAPGTYSRTNTPALVMVGHWGLDFHIAPPGQKPFDVLLVDRASG